MSLRLGDTAPDFHAETTDGPIDFHAWKGDSWVVFFSHPADYTPVCTTELGRAAGLGDRWASRGVKPIALSVDSLDDHLGWAPDIAEVTGNELNFPIVADPEKVVAEAYDMIHPGEGDTSTVRSVFVIDGNHTIRTILTYPKSVGRNFDEIVRVVDALQATDADPIATPADWQPGDRVIVPPTMTTDEARTKLRNVDEVKPYLRYADAP